jgi:hypothetical protein
MSGQIEASVIPTAVVDAFDLKHTAGESGMDLIYLTALNNAGPDTCCCTNRQALWKVKCSLDIGDCA